MSEGAGGQSGGGKADAPAALRDGDVDLVIAYRKAPNTWVPNNPSVSPFTEAVPSAIPSDGDDTRAIAVGDVNGDGIVDVG